MWHRAVLLVRLGTATGALVLFGTVGLFGHLAGLPLPARLAIVSTAVVIALFARLELPKPVMPGVGTQRLTPLRGAATWISWFTLVFLLALRVPVALIVVATLLPVLGVHLNTSQHALTPAARRTALMAPLLSHLGVMVAVLGAFGHAPLWVAAVSLWGAGLLLAARLALSTWIQKPSRQGQHPRVDAWLAHWSGGLVDPAVQCHALVRAGHIDAAQRMAFSLTPYLSTSIRHAMAWVAVQAACGEDTNDAFEWVTDRFPTHPHGPLGLSDALLSQTKPAQDWAVLAQDLAGVSLWSRSLLSVADANLARAYAAQDDPRAHDVVSEVLAAHHSDVGQMSSATRHRLFLAAQSCAHPAASLLRPDGTHQSSAHGALALPMWW